MRVFFRYEMAQKSRYNRRGLFRLILLVVVLCAGGALAQEIPWQPFVIDHAGRTNSAADVSFLLDAPAGRDGFIRVKDGHLVKPDGQRFRIWGVNLTGWTAGSTMLPPTNAAPVWAAELERFGINCVRFHFLDRTTHERPQGLIDGDHTNSLKLDPERLDRLDFFIAELKKRGIYSDLNLNVGRTYKPSDGVPDYKLIGVAKGMTYFEDRPLELQRDYAKQLLTHYNPYTRTTYCNEPAVAIVEIVNENSILEFWMRNWLRGELVNTNQLRYQLDLPPAYEKLLTAKYNEWLAKKKTPEELSRLRAEAGVKGDAPVPRLRGEEFSEAPKERFYAEAAFYTDMETGYFRDMEKYLKETLGVKSLVTGTADHTYWIPGLPLLRSTSKLDIVDAHVYWQHPAIYGARNTPMVNDPLHSAMVKLTRSAFAGKPFTVSEVNEPNPNEYACEMIPLLAAYGAFQDWDGVFFYTFEPKISGWQHFVTDPFDITLDPVKMVQMEAGALLFLRPDVKLAAKTERRSYSAAQINESMRLPESERPYFTPGFPLSLPLIHGSRVQCLDCEPTARFTAEDTNRIVSDTGELAWQVSSGASRWGEATDEPPPQSSGAPSPAREFARPTESNKTRDYRGLVTIDTERTQGLIGFVKANGRATSQLSADVQNDFCAITVSSLDGEPLSQSATMLLTACSRWQNNGVKWNERRTLWTKYGKGPTLIEPVKGWVTLHEIEGAVGMQLIPLDGAARPMGEPIRGRRLEDGWEIPLGTPATTWYLVRVIRSTATIGGK